MKKSMKIIIILLIAVFVIGIGVFIFIKNSLSMWIGGKQAEDYEKRIEIWNTVAGNSSDLKTDHMNIDENADIFPSALAFTHDVVGKEYSDSERTLDTYTFLSCIKSRVDAQTYEDKPYLIPYLVDGSDSAIIVVPGGAFGYKSITAGNNEGKEIAETLNKHGHNAFLLYYRSNPYEYPIPYLDLQRAVRYLRYHSEKYHIDKEKISMIGFSAGGNEIVTFINVIQGNDYFPENYIPDEVDAASDSVSSAAMIYPAMSFRYNVPMLFCMFDAKQVRNETEREKLLEMTDLYRHISSQGVKQFIAYGTKDSMVGMDETINYITHAQNDGCDVSVVVAEGQDHAFGQKYYMDEYIKWIQGIFDE